MLVAQTWETPGLGSGGPWDVWDGFFLFGMALIHGGDARVINTEILTTQYST